MTDEISGNKEQRDKKFIDMLNHIKDDIFALSKIDKESLLYKVLSDTQLAYTYIEMVIQCKMKNETSVAEFLGRPAFLWTENQLLAKLKRKHTLKSVPLYLKRIEYLIQMGFIKKVLFKDIDLTLLNLVDEEKLIGKPDLYIMVDVSSEMVSKIPYQKIDFDSINLQVINQKEKEEKLQKAKEKKGALSRSKITKTKNLKNNLKEESFLIHNKNKIDKTSISKQLKLRKNEEIGFEKTKELIDYNLRVINFDFDRGLFSSIDSFMKQNNIKEVYRELLKKFIVEKSFCLMNFKNKPCFYIEKEEMLKLFQGVNQKPVRSEEAKKSFDLLCEIGFFKRLSAEELEAGKNNSSLLTKENNISNFSPNSEIYLLLRLNERLLVKSHNKISVMNEMARERAREKVEPIKRNISDDIPRKPRKIESTKNPKVIKSKPNKDMDLSITECAIDILIESKIEGNKVIIDKYRFDKLLESILGEVPDI